MRALELLDANALSALSDPFSYHKGRNGVAAAQDARNALATWLVPEESSAARRTMGSLLEALLELHDRSPETYRTFLEGTLISRAAGTDAMALGTLPGMWHLHTVLIWLSDDHEYAIGGEGATVRLVHQHDLPEWRPGTEPGAVLVAAQARLQRVAIPPLQRPAPKSPSF